MSYSSEVLADSPLFWLRVDEASSASTAADSSGNSRAFTRSGSGGTNGDFGKTGLLAAESTNGAYGGITAGAGTVGLACAYGSWMNVTSLTVEAWIKTTQTLSGSIITRDAQSGTRCWQLGMSATGKVTFAVFAGSIPIATSSGSVNDGSEHHVAVSYDGTTALIYIDGVLDTTATLSQALPTPTQTQITIGNSNRTTTARWQGTIDEPALYGSILSATRIGVHRTVGVTPPTVTLAGTIGAVTGAFTVLTPVGLTFAGSIPAVTGAFSMLVGATVIPVTLAGSIPAVTGAFSLGVGQGLTLAGTVPAVTGSGRISALSRAAAVDADDPLFWLRLDESSGTVVHDSSGNGNEGTVTTGSLGWGQDSLVPTDPGNDAALFFSDTVTVPVTGGDAITVEGVIGSSVGSATLAARAGYFEILVENVSAGVKRIQVLNTRNGRSGISLTFASSATSVAWAAVFTTTDTLLYVRRSSSFVPGDAISDSGTYVHVPPDVDADFVISGGGTPLNAVLDEIAYYDDALTLEQVTRHAELGYVLEPAATLAGSIPAVTGAFTATVTTPVTFAGTIPAATGAFSLLTPVDAALAGTIGAVTGAFTVAVFTPVTFAGTIPAVTGAFTLPTGEVALAGVQQNVMGSFTVARQQGLTLAGTIAPVTGAFALTGSYQVQLTGTVPPVTSTFLLTYPPQTDTGNRASGRTRLGAGYVFYEPPVVEPPDFSIAQHAFVSARAYTGVDVSSGRAVVASPVKAVAKRARDRVVVGGRDVTFFRGVATPAPSYTLVAPLLYGPATLNLPQVAAAFEAPGVGDLAWCAKGKKVLVQRVDPDTNEVLATDYKGIVVAHDISGRTLQLQIGGEATGRAALIDKQPPLFFKRNDLGFWWWGAVQDLGLPFEPRLGIDTGIVLRNAGGMSQLDYMNDLSAKGTRRNGAQLTCMPDRHEDGGAYRVVTKDLETVTATVYLDDTVTIPDLRDDLAEQPNRVFATGVTPEGMRVKFGAYPVLRDDTPPPYPMTDGSHFGVGTTDGDTDSGDGVSVMIWRLVKAGYLALADKPGGFDDDVADAIRDLKQDAFSGFSVIDGDMTPAAWAALFDTSATGYSLAGTQILPAAQRSTTRKWNRTANGSVIGLNDDYDPSVPLVDTGIDTGVGMTRRQIRGFARGELAPTTGSTYVGTITLTSGALIAGDHTPGDPVTEADVLDGRALRPGDNISAPLFAGGTLFHVAGVDRRVDDSGVTTIVLDVDTQARDTMKVWEVIRRNRDSRRNPARAWLNQHRSSSLTKDSVIEFDEIGGVLDDRVDLAGGAWTVFPVVAGQEGTIGRLYLETIEPTEFVVAVFGREVQATMLRDVIGNPLTKGGKKKWLSTTIRKELDEDHVLLYIAGDKRNPCGYYPSLKHPADDPLLADDSADDATDGPDFTALTGEWKDSAGFGYRTFSAPVLWVAIWAAEASHLTPGRIMWPQLEAGS